jgi:hypothetical protein
MSLLSNHPKTPFYISRQMNRPRVKPKLEPKWEQFNKTTRNLHHKFNCKGYGSSRKTTQQNKQTKNVDGVSTEPSRRVSSHDSSAFK